MKLGAWMLCAILAACGGGGPSPEVCRTQARDLATLLRTMNHEPSAVSVFDAKLVTRSDLPAVEMPWGSLVHVMANGVRLNGQLATDELEIRERLEAMQRQAEDYTFRRPKDKVDPAMLHVVIDEDVRWDAVARVTEAAHAAGFTHPAFAFRLPSPEVKPPPRSKIDDELDALMNADDASNKATKLAEIAQRVIKPCPAMTEVFGNVAIDDGRSKADVLIDGIEPALTRCNCSLDMKSFASLMFRLLYVKDATTSAQITLAPDATPLALPAATPWRDAAARVTPGSTVWLAVQ